MLNCCNQISPVNTRSPPATVNQMLLFRISRYFGLAGGLALRMCEARFGVTRREWGVMATVAMHEGLLSSRLAETAQLDKARTSRALSGLEAKGWVQRTPVQGDRRRVMVSLTDEGRRMYELILPEMGKIHLDLVSVLGDAELAQLDATLVKLQAHAQELEKFERYQNLPRLGRNKGQKTL